MRSIRKLEKKLKINRIYTPETHIVGEWKSISQILDLVWEIKINRTINISKITEIHLSTIDKEEGNESLDWVKFKIKGDQKIFIEEEKDKVEKYLDGLMEQAQDKAILEISFFLKQQESDINKYKNTNILARDFDTCYKIFPVKSSQRNNFLQNRNQDIRNPVVILLNSNQIADLPHLNWRVNYIGVLFAQNEIEELRQIGLYYTRRYKSIKWVILQTLQYPHIPEYLPTQGIKSGIKDFQKLIQNCIMKPVSRALDQMKKDLSQKAFKLQTNLQSLSKKIPQDQDNKQKFVWNMIFQCVTKYSNEIKGTNTIQDIKSMSVASMTYSGGIVIKALFRGLYKQQTQQRILSQISNQSLQGMIKMYQNDSIPGFPSIQSFKYILTPHLNRLKQPAINLLNDVSNYLRVIYSKVFRSSLSMYGVELVEQVLNIVDTYMHFLSEKALKMVLSNIDCQLEIIMSNDYYYNNKHSDLIPKQETQSQFQSQTRVPTRSKHNSFSQVDNKNNQARQRQNNIIASFRKRVQDYYQMILKVLRDIIPKNIGYFLVLQSQKRMQFQIYQQLLLKSDVIMNIRQTRQLQMKREDIQNQIKSIMDKINLIVKEQAKII